MLCPRVDVVIPTFNRLWALRRVVPYYLGMELVRRVIVIDDCSTDGTAAWLSAFSREAERLVAISRGHRAGASAARNLGGKLAEAEFVLFADDDMLLAPSVALGGLVSSLESSGAAIVGPILTFDEGEELPKMSDEVPQGASRSFGMLDGYNTWTLERRDRSRLLSTLPNEPTRVALLTGIMLMRREVLERVSYDEDLGESSYRDDNDFHLKAVGAGLELFAVSDVYMLDFDRKFDTGGCRAIPRWRYELQACRNNWMMLRRHRSTLKRLPRPIPIVLRQLAFVVAHLGHRLPRYYVARLARWMRTQPAGA